MDDLSEAEFPADAVALVDDWSAVEAIGPDAAKFLNGFCTNDVAKLAEGESCEAMFTDVKARVIAHAWVARIGEERFVSLLSSDRAETLAAHLDRYLIRERVELTVLPSTPWKLCRASGDADVAVAIDAFGAGVVASPLAMTADAGGEPMAPDSFERIRIARGVPRDGVDVDERNLPQEVDRNDLAISFTKGCYLGQEPVARIDALGRVNWLLRGLRVAASPPARDAEIVIDGKRVGRVTSSAPLEGDATASVALAYVRREHAAEGGVAEVAGASATIHTLPMRR
ncbi:MAG: hypothetical protein AAF805_07225 [Planctomycetota bacterium]